MGVDLTGTGADALRGRDGMRSGDGTGCAVGTGADALRGRDGMRSGDGDFHQVVEQIETCITMGSSSATLEDSSDFATKTARCSVRVFERYSIIGDNRVSLSVTLFQSPIDGNIQLSAITSGGSQAIFFKINTFGEEAFLNKLRDALADMA